MLSILMSLTLYFHPLVNFIAVKMSFFTFLIYKFAVYHIINEQNCIYVLTLHKQNNLAFLKKYIFFLNKFITFYLFSKVLKNTCRFHVLSGIMVSSTKVI